MTSTTATNAFNIRKRDALPWNPLPFMDEYLAQKEAEQHHRSQIRGIKMSLSHFAESLRAEGVLHPEDITRVHLIKFQGQVNSRGWSPNYSSETLKRVRAWLAWMAEIGYVQANPWVSIRVPTIRKRPKPLSDDELFDLFKAHRAEAFGGHPFTYHRRELILVLLYGWGLRIHELAALDMEDMDPRREFVRARNKGGGVKHLPYLDEMKHSFQRWAAWRIKGANLEPNETALLVNRGGTRMTTSDIWSVVHDLGDKAHVTINPHRLRDTCATHLLDSDVPVERVAMILGHGDIKTTLGYGQVNNHKVAESLDAAMSMKINGLVFGRTKDLMKP